MLLGRTNYLNVVPNNWAQGSCSQRATAGSATARDALTTLNASSTTNLRLIKLLWNNTHENSHLDTGFATSVSCV